jgi:hypothetical protein
MSETTTIQVSKKNKAKLAELKKQNRLSNVDAVLDKLLDLKECKKILADIEKMDKEL